MNIMHKSKITSCIFMSAVMLLCLLAIPSTATAASPLGIYNGLIYAASDDAGASVVGFDRENASATSVSVPDAVTFGGTNYNVTGIGDGAFVGYTSLSAISIGGNVTIIGEGAFYGCPLASVTIPNSVTAIHELAFAGTDITSVTIPASITEIGAGAFAAPGLLAFAVNAGNTSFKAESDILLTKDGGELIAYPAAKSGGISFPDSVTKIGPGAFMSNYTLTGIAIPDRVTVIGEGAFSFCIALSNVTIGNGVAEISEGAFSNCMSLASIALPDSVESIEGNAFYGTGLTAVTIPASVAEIGPGAFAAPQFADFAVSGGTHYKVVDGLLLTYDGTELAAWPLAKAGDITFPSSVTKIGPGAFSGYAALTNYSVPYGITSIGESAFFGCSNLALITIPDSVTYIGEGAFTSTALTTVEIPDSVTYIGASAFAACYDLRTVTFLRAVPPEFGMGDEGEGVFYVVTGPLEIIVPAGSQSLYETALDRHLPYSRSFSEAEAVTYVVSGRITGSDAPAGLAAVLQLHSGSVAVGSPVTAAPDGSYIIPGAQSGSGYTIAVSMSGYEPGAIPAFDIVGNTKNKDLVLQRSARGGNGYSGGGSSSSIEKQTDPEPEPEAVAGANPDSKPQNISFINSIDAWTNIFSDVKSADWYYNAVAFANLNGLFAGVGDGRFAPNDTMTRAMFVTVLYRMAGSPDITATENPFADVPEGSYYGNATLWAADIGIASGTGNGNFSPDIGVTREQMAVFLANYASRTGITIPEVRSLMFEDSAQISAWAKNAVNVLAQAGVINGRGNSLFEPQETATRAEVAAILFNFAKALAGN
jgi:hypothetical protein